MKKGEPTNIGETPLARNDDLLAARELIAGATKSFLNNCGIRVSAPDREDDLANVDTGNGAVGLAPCTTHAGLQPAFKQVSRQTHTLDVMPNVPICASTRQHLVDSKDVERVHTNPQVERVFASGLCYIFVGTDTRSLKRFAGELLILVGDKVAAERELIDRSTLPAEVKDTDLRRN